LKAYIISPLNVPQNQMLFPLFCPIWEANGDTIVKSIGECDVVYFDLHSRQFDYNQNDIDYLIENKIPVVTFDEWDRGNMSTDQWPNPLKEQQQYLFNHILGGEIKAIHFSRLLDKRKKYANVFPYEKPIIYEEEQSTEDDLFNREYDVTLIANHSPSREQLAKCLLDDGRLKCNISLGQKKIPFNDFINEHRKSKMFISCGAGGYTDERVQALFSICGIIRENTDQLLLHDFTDFVSFKISNPPTKKELDKLVDIVNNKGKLYQNYINGFTFVKTYYTKEYIAKSISEIVKRYL